MRKYSGFKYTIVGRFLYYASVYQTWQSEDDCEYDFLIQLAQEDRLRQSLRQSSRPLSNRTINAIIKRAMKLRNL